uniref:Uncharacterized protein n=1 Tax=Megaselia scalaris TaxID=36166 RepID=T1H0L2_MEGSC
MERVNIPATNHIKSLAVLFEEIYLPLLSNEHNKELWPPTAAKDIQNQIKQMQRFLEETAQMMSTFYSFCISTNTNRDICQ